MKTLVVVPAYNEATTIQPVLASVQAKGFPVLVVDDGSIDTTYDVARHSGALVVRHVINRGLGAALRTGFAFALSEGYDAVVTLDADGQHDPEEIPQLLAPLAEGADVVIGTRMREAMPIVRQVYNAAGALLTSSLFGGALLDSQSGYRALRSDTLKKFALTTSRMEISSEILAEAHRVGAVIRQAPITVRYTEYSMSKGQGFFEGVRTAWRLLLRACSQSFR